MYEKIADIFINLNLTTNIKIKIILDYQSKSYDSLELIDWLTIKVLHKLIRSEDGILTLYKTLSQDEINFFDIITEKAYLKTPEYD